VLVVGATSSIARQVAAAYARRGYGLYVAGRSAEETDRVAADLRLRHGVTVHAGTFEAADTSSHADFVARVAATVGGDLEGVVVAVGLLGEQRRAVREFSHAREIIDANFVGPASLLSAAANHLESRGRGFLVGISSVAGDRGRASNYVYGSAKAAASVFLEGLRHRLAPRGVRVCTVKPGFVDTPMTYGLPGTFLVADPASVGERIVLGVELGRGVIYVPAFWRWVMLAIRAIPEWIFMRTRL
jgi:short-subunit dehydrogenase